MSKRLIYKHIITIIMLAMTSVVSSGTAYFIHQKLNTPYWVFIDAMVENFAIMQRNPLLTSLMTWVSLFGYWGVILLFSLIVGVLVFKKRYEISLTIASIAMAGYGAGYFIKTIVQRPRPTVYTLVTESGYSFPSLHTLMSSLLFLSIIYLVFNRTRSYLMAMLVEAAAIIIFITIGFSRIYLGVHRFSDVAAGFAISFSVISFILAVQKLIWLVVYARQNRV